MQLGVGGGTGFVVGYGLRKIASVAVKVVAVVVTLLTLPLVALQYMGIIKVNYDALTSLAQSIFSQVAEFAMSVAPKLLEALPITGSFGLGLLAGALKK